MFIPGHNLIGRSTYVFEAKSMFYLIDLSVKQKACFSHIIIFDNMAAFIIINIAYMPIFTVPTDACVLSIWDWTHQSRGHSSLTPTCSYTEWPLEKQRLKSVKLSSPTCYKLYGTKQRWLNSACRNEILVVHRVCTWV